MAKKKEPKASDFVDEESGAIYVEVVREEVAKAMVPVEERMDEISGGQEKLSEEMAYIRNELAEATALATAAARAAAVPPRKKESWEPLPIERYPKQWVEEHGTTQVALLSAPEHGIMFNGFWIPLEAGHIICVPKNIAAELAHRGLV